jgi:N-methylhydantoinase A
MHAVAVARELDMDEVVVPYFPGGFSAFGMTVGSSRVEYSQALMTPYEDLGAERLDQVTAELEERCRQDLRDQGIPDEKVGVTFGYYGMYTGQGQDNRLPLPDRPYDEAALAATATRFHQFYEWRFGYQAPEIPIFVTSVQAVAVGQSEPVKLPDLEGRGSAGGSIADAVSRRADLHLDGETHPDSPFYDRAGLRVGDEVDGPCVIDDHLGTIVVNAGAVARVVEHGTLRIQV